VIRLLSFASGVPALIYQIVWTREISLLVGGQMEAISLVIVAFFGGLALGARLLGAWVDRIPHPLRAYAGFEVLAGSLALISIPGIRWLGETLPAAGAETWLSLAGILMIFPVTFLLGGTTPALLRASVQSVDTVARHAGGLAGVNTAGSVLGVCAAVWMIPELGLQTTLGCAALVAIILGLIAFTLSGRFVRPELVSTQSTAVDLTLPEVVPLAVAFVAGVATLAFEVVAARMAGIQLGSSLYAWGTVLAGTLLGLALGNIATARRAAETESPYLDLARIEFLASLLILLGLLTLSPNLTVPSSGLTIGSILAVFCGVFPPALAMGAAFPFLVRISATKPALGRAFGAVSAANTAGGIVGALVSSFYILVAIGPAQGAVACAGLNGILAAALSQKSRAGRSQTIALASGLAAFFLLSWIALVPPELPDNPRVIHLGHGRQATAAVLLYGDRRDLVVDGDPEASTASDARATEEYLAILPTMLHPNPQRFLEVGLGSGTTFGTASRFPLLELECVEIAASVLNAAPFFEPDNRHITTRKDDRVRILRGDGRAHLLKRRGRFDIVVANTLHPWSLGATGLYSREYFGRLAGALRPGGIAAQWLPLGVIGEDHLAAILRSFYDAFEHGALYWGAGNVMLVGSERPIERLGAERFDRLAPLVEDALGRIGIDSVAAFNQRRIADLPEILATLGDGEMLYDDRPVLEARTYQRDHAVARNGENRLLHRIATAARLKSTRHEPVALFIESRAVRSSGDSESADRLEKSAELSGFEPARQTRLLRELAAANELRAPGDERIALEAFKEIANEASDFADAWFAIAQIEYRNDRFAAARDAMERVVALQPMRGEAWNLLALASWQLKDLGRAGHAFSEAVTAAPFLPEALAGAGGFALSRNDVKTAAEMLRRLDALAVYGPLKEATALRQRMQSLR
jgi:predicted membrane-bound spermidine synthase/Flp pilus assembly protein TadD